MIFWATGIVFKRKKINIPELYIGRETKTSPGETDLVKIYF